MGESVKIRDLIYKIINLSGLTVKDSKNPNGDIEIKIIGLRPGEKLYEELLIGNDPQKTGHPKILMTKDPFMPLADLEKNLNNLEILLNDNKIKDVKNLIEKLLKSYKSNSKIVDHLHNERLSSEKYDQNLTSNNANPNKVIKFIK
jgi:FlaA1/EpsC-like NDP-sugar epimerase